MIHRLNNLAILLSSSVITGNEGSIDGGYIVWDPTVISRGLGQIKEWIGMAFNVGIWVFLIISGIYLIVSIVRSLFG